MAYRRDRDHDSGPCQSRRRLCRGFVGQGEGDDPAASRADVVDGDARAFREPAAQGLGQRSDAGLDRRQADGARVADRFGQADLTRDMALERLVSLRGPVQPVLIRRGPVRRAQIDEGRLQPFDRLPST